MIGRWEFRLAVLQAIERIGDEKAVQTVARLAHGEATTTNEKRLRKAAQSCLSVLNARIAQQRVQQTLLRPSDAPPQQDTILLRPVQGASAADPDLLVRPALGNGDERSS